MNAARNFTENDNQRTMKKPPQQKNVVVRKTQLASCLDRIFKASRGLEYINRTMLLLTEQQELPAGYEFLVNIDGRASLHGAMEILIGVIEDAEYELFDVAIENEQTDPPTRGKKVLS